jgi:hypothetical protein
MPIDVATQSNLHCFWQWSEAHHERTHQITAQAIGGAVPAALSTNKKYYRSFNKERVRRTLEAELAAGSYPPQPMSKVARKLGYDHSFLCKYYPDLCRAISARFEAYRVNQCEEKKQGIICEVRRAALKVHSEGLYPSQVRVRNLLIRPGSIRIPEALHAWHTILKELGWEK